MSLRHGLSRKELPGHAFPILKNGWLVSQMPCGLVPNVEKKRNRMPPMMVAAFSQAWAGID